MDRVPLDQVVDKEEVKEPQESRLEAISEDKSITEMMDMKALSILLGFETGDFDGMGMKAQELYEWSKEMTGLKGGPDVILAIKEQINRTGMKEKGKTLLNKIHRWSILNDGIRELRTKQRILEDV